jgi:putative hemolysin
VKRDDGSFLVDGITSIDEVVQRTELVVQDADSARFDTLAGYVLTLLGYIPQAGTVVEAHGWRLEVMDMDGLRIDKVLIRKQ